MKQFVFSLFLFFLLSCKNRSITKNEQEKIIQFVVGYEENDPLSSISKCKKNKKYLVNSEFTKSIRLNDSIQSKVDPKLNAEEIKKEYAKRFRVNNDISNPQFELIDAIKNFSKNSPSYLSFSKPLKYWGYYFVEINFEDWSSGYGNTYILKEDSLGNLRVVYKAITWRS